MHAFRSAHEAREHKRGRQLSSNAMTRDEAGARAHESDIANRRQTTRSALTEPELRRQVLCDLNALMNTVALDSTQSLAEFDHARLSILNFGCPDISTRTIDEARLVEVRKEIEDAIRTFEPRLISETLKVSREAVGDDDLRLRYVVRADLACVPVSVPVQFVADVELDSGSVSVQRL